MKTIFAILLGCVTALGDEVLTKEERIIALTLLGEARGEGKRGIFAVGCVIQRRSWERKMNPMKVCLEPWQFGPWNAGGGKIKKESELDHLWKSKHVIYARYLARCLNNENITLMDITESANHFYSTDRKKPPYWTFDKETKKPIKPAKKIGKHLFYKLPRHES